MICSYNITYHLLTYLSFFKASFLYLSFPSSSSLSLHPFPLLLSLATSFQLSRASSRLPSYGRGRDFYLSFHILRKNNLRAFCSEGSREGLLIQIVTEASCEFLLHKNHWAFWIKKKNSHNTISKCKNSSQHGAFFFSSFFERTRNCMVWQAAGATWLGKNCLWFPTGLFLRPAVSSNWLMCSEYNLGNLSRTKMIRCQVLLGSLGAARVILTLHQLTSIEKVCSPFSELHCETWWIESQTMIGICEFLPKIAMFQLLDI